MSYIIGSKCVGVCDTVCVYVCPVDCIHGPIHIDQCAAEVHEDGFDPSGKQLYINPEDCIDCGACLPECPVDAIYEDEQDAIDKGEKDYVHKNYNFFKISIPTSYI